MSIWPPNLAQCALNRGLFILVNYANWHDISCERQLCMYSFTEDYDEESDIKDDDDQEEHEIKDDIQWSIAIKSLKKVIKQLKKVSSRL